MDSQGCNTKNEKMKHIAIKFWDKYAQAVKIGGLILVLIVAFRFLVKDALPYYSFDPNVFGRLWESKWWLIGHIGGGTFGIAHWSVPIQYPLP